MSVAPVIAKVGIPVILEGLRTVFSKINNPISQGASAAIGSVLDALTTGAISPEQASEMNRHLEKLAELESLENKTALEQINTSLRAEVASSDLYVRRMRPTFGYLMALTWAAQMFAVAYVIIFKTSQASVVVDALSSLGTIWTVGLSVLGIYVYKRSEEKSVLLKNKAGADRDKATPSAMKEMQPRYNP